VYESYRDSEAFLQHAANLRQMPESLFSRASYSGEILGTPRPDPREGATGSKRADLSPVPAVRSGLPDLGAPYRRATFRIRFAEGTDCQMPRLTPCGACCGPRTRVHRAPKRA
jgi:hypothetical protein